jgi:hypothetical protein
MPARLVMAMALLLALTWQPVVAADQSARMILALGNTGFLDSEGIHAATGAVVKTEMGRFQLQDFSVLVLADVAFLALPAPIQQGLAQYVSHGGAVLITGGPHSFGSGGYQAVAPIIPFQIRSADDWRATPFREPVPLQPGHPILAGVEFITVGNLNDMNPRPDAKEILRGPGGDRTYPSPLIAELEVGDGRVVGVAFDPNELSGMRDRDLFVRNTIEYLLSVSRIGPPS